MRSTPWLAAVLLATLAAACGDGGSGEPLPTVVWEGPSSDVIASFAREEACAVTTALAEKYNIPTQIVYEDGVAYWLFETVDPIIQRAGEETPYRLGSLSLLLPPSMSTLDRLYIVNNDEPVYAFEYRPLGCH
jgi:hypothetical protein